MPDTEILTLPILPLRSGVVLPQMVITLALDSTESRTAAAGLDAGDRVLLVPRHDDRLAKVGTIAVIENRGGLPRGTEALVVRAERRARIGTGVIGASDALWVQAEPLTEPEPSARARELATELRAALRALLERLGGPRLVEALAEVTEPGSLADTAGWWPELAMARKIELLETIDVEERVEKVLAWAKEALAEQELADRIRTDVTDGMEKQQREFLLRQQMAAIRKELGEDPDEDLADGFRQRVAERDLPGGVRTAIDREIDRLERTSEQSPEHGWIRTWLETITELPWDVRTDDDLDLTRTRGVLDADHTGLEEVKERIVEYLAVRKLRSERGIAEPTGRRAGAIITLVGPPGVGKTSLGESVARALGRKFVRVALGGIHDEAAIRGHRRTYVGAQAGRIVAALTEAGTMNPVFLLDEVDKVGADWRGDPSSALLEVLDPAQNHSFRDHYLEVDLDLSDVLFIATANVLDTIPAPLLDRMEIITLDGYTEAEKVAIARDHLLPRQRERHGLADDELVITDEALASVVSSYTREAGVRGLERQLATVARKSATRIANGSSSRSDDSAGPVTIDVDDLAGPLGRPRFFDEVAARTGTPGVATGLAVTGAGGDVLFVEANATDGDAGLTLTGQLGDVMRESAEIALSYVRSHREELGVSTEALNRRFHVHVPAGAVPKDGPSAGVTMASALVSLLVGRAVRPTVGMTGEVTLQGRVLPIGGVKQKVLAAHRAGLTDVVLPARNGADLDDVPESVRTEMTFHLADHLDQVLDVALEPVAPEVAAAA